LDAGFKAICTHRRKPRREPAVVSRFEIFSGIDRRIALGLTAGGKNAPRLLRGNSGGVLSTYKRTVPKFKFLKRNDDDSLAFVAQEKPRLGLVRRGSYLARVAVLTSGPHQATQYHTAMSARR
jgi:hypothetical protein